MTDELPRIETEQTPDGACVVLRGDWSAVVLARQAVWEPLQAQLALVSTVQAWDLRQLQRMDHIAAQLLWNVWNHQ